MASIPTLPVGAVSAANPVRWPIGVSRLKALLRVSCALVGACPASEPWRQARAPSSASRHARTVTAAGAAFASDARSHVAGCQPFRPSAVGAALAAKPVRWPIGVSRLKALLRVSCALVGVCLASETWRQARAPSSASRHARTVTAAGAAFVSDARSHVAGCQPFRPSAVGAALAAKPVRWPIGVSRLKALLRVSCAFVGACLASETRRQARVPFSSCCHTQAGTAANAAFASEARSHGGAS